MAAPKKILAGLLIVMGSLLLGAWIPLSEVLFTYALEQGGFMANLAFLTLLAATGLGLLIWGMLLLRDKKR
jgi:hypothetical protein